MPYERFGRERRELIGTVGVDTGTIMIIDPCNIDVDKRDNSDPADEYLTFDEWFAALYPDKDRHPHERSQGKEFADVRGGMIVDTLVGDGSYPIYRVMQGNQLMRIEILVQQESDEDIEAREEEERGW